VVFLIVIDDIVASWILTGGNLSVDQYWVGFELNKLDFNHPLHYSHKERPMGAVGTVQSHGE